MKLLTVRSPLSSETVVCLLLPTSWSLLGLISASQPAERVLDLPDGQTSALACLILTVSSLVFQAKAALICSVSLQVTSSNPVYTRYTYLTSKKVRESLNLTETKHRVITKNTSAFSLFAWNDHVICFEHFWVWLWLFTKLNSLFIGLINWSK